MLVLSRKQNQEIIVGDDVRLTVLQVKGNTVRLGIEAPREVSVRRAELPPKPNKAKVTVVFRNDADSVETTAKPERIPNLSVVDAEFEIASTDDSRPEKNDSQNRLKQIVSRLTK